LKSLVDRLCSRNWKGFCYALLDAVEQGAEGEAAILGVLDRLGEERKKFALAALLEVQGEAAPAVMRDLLQKKDTSREIRMSALTVLTDRCGVAASADLAAALDGRDWQVQGLAVYLLAQVGDDRAWDRIFERLGRHLRRSERTACNLSEVLVEVCYLARHAEGTGSERCIRLVHLLRSRWKNLTGAGPFVNERQWMGEHWPECRPDGPPPEGVKPPGGEKLVGLVTEGLDNWPLRKLLGVDEPETPKPTFSTLEEAMDHMQAVQEQQRLATRGVR
jgi:hypothetical protein